MSAPTRSTPLRLYALDWLRVLATGAVFLFHAARMFDLEDWHVKNNQLTTGFSIWTAVLDVWIMPILFVISGASIYLALRSRSGGRFLTDRVKRLLIPLVFGVLVLTPPQVYLERITHGQFNGSFLEFYPHFFNAPYFEVGGTGNLAFHGLHLWYLLILFLLSVIALPLFLLLRRENIIARLTGWTGWLRRPLGVMLLAVPVIALEIGLPPDSIGMRDLGGWSVVQYLLLLIYGFLLLPLVGLDTLANSRRVLLGAAVAVFAVLFVGAFIVPDGPYGSMNYAARTGVRGLTCWLGCLAMLGYAQHYLAFTHPRLDEANELVLPFYILHHPVVLFIDYAIADQPWPALLKYALVLVTAFPLIVALCELVVKRFGVTRFLFGMKPLRKPADMAVRTRTV